MKHVYDAIIACRNNPSKNAKIDILTDARSPELREFLRVVYEPRINFYQKKIDTKNTSVSNIMDDVRFDLDTVTNVYSTLGMRQLTGKTAKTWLSNLYNGFQNDWEREMLQMLIERDVRAGFSGNTVNKVFGEEVVTDVPYMRCSLPKDAKLDKFNWKKGVYSQVKADGMFANVTHELDGTVSVRSRNGSPFPLVGAFNSLIAEVQALVPRGYQLHGELLMYFDRKPMNRQEGNGKFNTLLQSGELADGFFVVYECWDIIPLEQAKAKNKYKVPFYERHEYLKSLMVGERLSLWQIETRVVHSLKEAYDHYRDALERGLEGTIVKDPDELIWEDSTSKWQVKLKLEFEVDLEVVGYEEGKGKAAGMLGALLTQTSDGKLKVQVGSGFSDEQRKDIWARKDLKIIAVKSNSILPPTRKETYSLFLPIFVEERLDKTEADSLQRVMDQYDATIAAVGQ